MKLSPRKAYLHRMVTKLPNLVDDHNDRFPPIRHFVIPVMAAYTGTVTGVIATVELPLSAEPGVS